MKRLVAFFAVGLGFLFAGSLWASAPVKVTLTGCVNGGVIVTERTDFGTHSSEGKYRIKPLEPKGAPFDLVPYGLVCLLASCRDTAGAKPDLNGFHSSSPRF